MLHVVQLGRARAAGVTRLMGRRKTGTERRAHTPKDPCAYCGGEATESDHVPPQGLFTEREEPLLIKVPACHSCNNDPSSDEEYLIWALTLRIKATGSIAEAAQAERLKAPAKPRRQRMMRRVIKSSMPVELRTLAGLYLGEARAFDPKMDRVNRALSKVVRGLYFRETGARVPEDHDVVARLEPGPEVQALPMIQALLQRRPRVVVPDGFEYGFGRYVDAPTWAVVLMRFFRGLAAVGFVRGPRGKAAEENTP
jgi:hypothetical protein